MLGDLMLTSWTGKRSCLVDLFTVACPRCYMLYSLWGLVRAQSCVKWQWVESRAIRRGIHGSERQRKARLVFWVTGGLVLPSAITRCNGAIQCVDDSFQILYKSSNNNNILLFEMLLVVMSCEDYWRSKKGAREVVCLKIFLQYGGYKLLLVLKNNGLILIIGFNEKMRILWWGWVKWWGWKAGKKGKVNKNTWLYISDKA